MFFILPRDRKILCLLRHAGFTVRIAKIRNIHLSTLCNKLYLSGKIHCCLVRSLCVAGIYHILFSIQQRLPLVIHKQLLHIIGSRTKYPVVIIADQIGMPVLIIHMAQ